MIDILLYSHHLPAWYCIDIVRRNSVLVTCGSERVKCLIHEITWARKKFRITYSQIKCTLINSCDCVVKGKFRNLLHKSLKISAFSNWEWTFSFWQTLSIRFKQNTSHECTSHLTLCMSLHSNIIMSFNPLTPKISLQSAI